MNVNKVFQDLWQDKPLLITLLAGLAAILYILWKNHQGSMVVAPDAAPAESAQPTIAGGTLIEYSYYNNSPTTINNPTTPVAPPPGGMPGPLNPVPALSNGLLGAHAGAFNFKNLARITYSQDHVNKVTSLPAGTKIKYGNLNRVWYILPGEHLERLLTSGTGGAVNNDPHPAS